MVLGCSIITKDCFNLKKRSQYIEIAKSEMASRGASELGLKPYYDEDNTQWQEAVNIIKKYNLGKYVQFVEELGVTRGARYRDKS